VRLEERELAAVWASACRHQVSGPVRAARRRDELGLPRVAVRSRTARRHRAVARARGEAGATLGAPEVPGAPEVQGGQEVTDTVPWERIGTRTRSSRTELKVQPVILLRGRVLGDLSLLVRGVPTVIAVVLGTTQQLRSPSLSPAVFLLPPIVVHVRLHVPHCRDLFSCGGSRPSRTRSITIQ